MLIWINGPFGGGKTQVAYELHRRLPGSLVCDPEEVGFGLHRMLPGPLREDFQDLPAWRQGVREVLEQVLHAHPGVVLAPMTVVEPDYLAEILDPPRAAGHEVRHVSLLAERATVLCRLRERNGGRLVQLVAGADASLRRESFAVGKLDLCLERLSGKDFGSHVWTDGIGVGEVADRVAADTGLTLDRNTDGRFRSWIRRSAVSLRHVRR